MLDSITGLLDMRLCTLWEIVKDREAWHAAVQVARVGHNLVTEQQLLRSIFISKSVRKIMEIA